MTLPCACEHPYQDATYGKGVRVHNRMTKTTGTYRCTVCSKVKEKKGDQAQ